MRKGEDKLKLSLVQVDEQKETTSRKILPSAPALLGKFCSPPLHS
jgi:hypothetical protein